MFTEGSMTHLETSFRRNLISVENLSGSKQKKKNPSFKKNGFCQVISYSVPQFP